MRSLCALILVLLISPVLFPTWVHCQPESREDAARLLVEARPLERRSVIRSGTGYEVRTEGYYPTPVASGQQRRSKQDSEKDSGTKLQNKLELLRKSGINPAALGAAYYSIGRYHDALDRFQGALIKAGQSGSLSQKAIALNGIGVISFTLGNYQEALKNLDHAAALVAKLADDRSQPVIMHNIGVVHYELGHYEKAMGSYERALPISRRFGDVEDEASLLYRSGQVYQALGQNQRALDYYQQSLSIAERLDDTRGTGPIMEGRGSPIPIHMGPYDEVLDDMRAGRVIDFYLAVPVKWPKDLMGNIYLDEGKLDKAEKLIVQAGYSGSLGRLYLSKGDPQSAKKHYEVLLRSSEATGSSEGLFVSYTGLGKVYEALKQYDRAAQHYARAMQVVEEMRSQVDPEQRRMFFEVRTAGFLRTEPAKGLTRVRMKLNQASQSMVSSEATRARVLADGIALRSQVGFTGVPSEILKREEDITLKIAVLKRERAKVEKGMTPDRYYILTRQIEKVEDESRRFVQMLWGKYRQYAAIKYPRPINLSEAAIRPDEHVVYFDLVGDGVVAKLIKGNKIVKTQYEKWRQEDLEGDVKRFLAPLRSMNLRAFDPSLARKLYDRLLRDVVADVPHDVPLTIIPDGILAVLPFEALVTSGKAEWQELAGRPILVGLTYVGDLHPISYYPSITALTLARAEKKESTGERTMVIADPIFRDDDERVRRSAQTTRHELLSHAPETLMAAEKATGMIFNRLRLTRRLGEYLKSLDPSKTDLVMAQKAEKSFLFKKPLTDYRAIVFATHGYFGNDIPGIHEPVLALTMINRDGTAGGFLRMTEVMGMKLNADVVALTACQTGLGKNLSGEGVMSMGRAFQYAGARSILMSLWSVAEGSSVKLVGAFFKNLKDGKGQLQSLQLARKEIRKQGFDHPFFWAPFVLVGEVK